MLLLRGATLSQYNAVYNFRFQYMLLLRGATYAIDFDGTIVTVSIHAPLARSNFKGWNVDVQRVCFNTCSSCEEQHAQAYQSIGSKRFNTCSSCEEQLHRLKQFRVRTVFQYMLLLRGATISEDGVHRGVGVSIHAPLARSNKRSQTTYLQSPGFNTCSSCEEQLGAVTLARYYRGFNTCSSCEEQLLFHPES